VGHYSVGPERQWWEKPIQHWGIRYSFTLAIATAAGFMVHLRNLKCGKKFLSRHEVLILAFLAGIWLVYLTAPATVGRYTAPRIDHPVIKFTKIMVFVLMLTHIVTTAKNLDRLVWVLIVGALFLGLQAWATPRRAFASGRLETVGGVDFTESNFFSAYMATLLCLIGAQFFRTGKWGKLLCLVSGAFTANAIVLTRSRGAVMGLGVGAITAVFLSPREHRRPIALGLIVAFCGFLYVSDPQFLDRASTIFRSEDQRDKSAQSRIVLAKAGLRIAADNPFGIGVGNFYQTIGKYLPDYAGKDAHNTYVRCLTETGIQGFAVFLALIASAFVTLRRLYATAASLPPTDAKNTRFLAFGLTIGLVTLLSCCLTVSLTYVEFLWWFLALPVCLQRAVENRLAEPTLEGALAATDCRTHKADRAHHVAERPAPKRLSQVRK